MGLQEGLHPPGYIIRDHYETDKPVREDRRQWLRPLGNTKTYQDEIYPIQTQWEN